VSETGLIPQPHGGALRPGQRPDEPGRNPWGYGGKPETRLKKALELALEQEGGVDRIVRAIAEVAEDKNHPAMLGAARLLLERLYGPVPKAHLHAQIDTGVLRRKVREVTIDAELVSESSTPSTDADIDTD